MLQIDMEILSHAEIRVIIAGDEKGNGNRERVNMSEDTISQIATPHGVGGIGIIRVSGAEAFAIAREIFRPARGDLGEIAPYRARYGQITAADGTVIDDCILLPMRAPHS